MAPTHLSDAGRAPQSVPELMPHARVGPQTAAGQANEMERAMPSERIHLPIVAAMLVAGSTALAIAQTGGSGTGGTSGSPAGTTGGATTGSSSAAPNQGQPTSPSAMDTTGAGGSQW